MGAPQTDVPWAHHSKASRSSWPGWRLVPVAGLVLVAPEEPAAVVVPPACWAWARAEAVVRWIHQSQPLAWEVPDVAAVPVAAAVSAADWPQFPSPRKRRYLGACGDPTFQPNVAGQAVAVVEGLRVRDPDSSGPATSRRVPLRSKVCWDDD